MKLFTTLAFGLSLLLASASANAWELAEMNNQIDQTNFIVNEGCAGTLVDLERKRILSAEHCVSNLTKIIEEEVLKDDGTVEKIKKYYRAPLEVGQIIRDENGNVTGQINYRAKIIRTKKSRDLALIEIQGPIENTQAATVATEVTRGETAYIVGNPVGFNNNLTKGVVSHIKREIPSLSGHDGSRVFTQIDGGVWFGNSGGGLFNEEGELIGVVIMVYRPAPHMGFAVDLQDVHEFLEDPAPVVEYSDYGPHF